LLAELFEQLPETGDPDKPRLALFFDEAHLLFDGAPKALLEKIEQVVRLIRSKGVGVYFVSQSPLDISEDVLGQLGLRIQHALRAFTPKDRKAVRAVARNFRSREGLDTETVITELGIGEALVSVLDRKGAPTPVERIWMAPPRSRIGPMPEDERLRRIQDSPFSGKYDRSIDRDSAFEMLQRKAEASARQAEAEEAEKAREARRESGRSSRASGRSRRRQSLAEAMMKSFGRSIASSLGRKLARGLLGSLLK
jgi:DNA helicase HerA-like ATPase